MKSEEVINTLLPLYLSKFTKKVFKQDKLYKEEINPYLFKIVIKRSNDLLERIHEDLYNSQDNANPEWIFKNAYKNKLIDAGLENRLESESLYSNNMKILSKLMRDFEKKKDLFEILGDDVFELTKQSVFTLLYSDFLKKKINISNESLINLKNYFMQKVEDYTNHFKNCIKLHYKNYAKKYDQDYRIINLLQRMYLKIVDRRLAIKQDFEQDFEIGFSSLVYNFTNKFLETLHQDLSIASLGEKNFNQIVKKYIRTVPEIKGLSMEEIYSEDVDTFHTAVSKFKKTKDLFDQEFLDDVLEIPQTILLNLIHLKFLKKWNNLSKNTEFLWNTGAYINERIQKYLKKFTTLFKYNYNNFKKVYEPKFEENSKTMFI